jgi:SEC-C motif domain protein
MPDPTRCPCSSGETYAQCCERAHRGVADAPTAVALMRSRFAAFARGDAAYLLRTWAASTRPRHLRLDDRLTWTDLEIVNVVGGGLFDRSATVEFRAHYRVGTDRSARHERSRFARIDGRWFYVDGETGPDEAASTATRHGRQGQVGRRHR